MAIIGSISNDQSLIKGTDAHDDQYHSELKNEWTLVWSMDDSGSVANPTLKDYGEMTTSLSGVNYTRPENWPRSHGMAASGALALSNIGNGDGWARLIFTSVNHPYRMHAMSNRYDGSDNATSIIIRTLFSSRSNWTAAQRIAINSAYKYEPCCGSSCRIGTLAVCEHNNNNSETHDMPTFGEGFHVWSNGMFWGNIDATTNYGGLLNLIDGHSGSGGGATNDKLLIYLDTYYPKANDYEDVIAGGRTGNHQDSSRGKHLVWSSSTSTSVGGNLKYLAFPTDRFTTTNWDSHGYQHGPSGSNDGYIQLDLGSGNAIEADFTFAITYFAGVHCADSNYIKGSNDGSSWTTLAEWNRHNAGGSGAHTNTSRQTVFTGQDFADGSANLKKGYSLGYLVGQEGGHCYSNTVNNVEKWIPLKKNAGAFRYWRIGGTGWNTNDGIYSGNNRQLLINWGLMKKKDNIDLRGGWTMPFQSVQDADSAGVPDGLYWFQNPDGTKEQLYVAIFDEITGEPANSGSRWVLVASNNAFDRKIPDGTTRRSTRYRLDRSGATPTGSRLGLPNPDADYIIGSFITQFKFKWCKIHGWGHNTISESNNVHGNHVPVFKYNERQSLTCTWQCGGNNDQTPNTQYPNPLESVTRREDVKISGGAGLHSNATHFVVDAILKDSGLNANSNQTTIGGAGVHDSNGDPSSGCLMGHGGSESYCEGWYEASGNAYNSQGYTTWVR